MDIKLDIKPEDVNKYLVETILKSTVGESIKKLIETEVKKIEMTYDNPYKSVIQIEINEIIHSLLSTQYKNQIEDEVKKRITPELVQGYIDNAWDKIVGRR